MRLTMPRLGLKWSRDSGVRQRRSPLNAIAFLLLGVLGGASAGVCAPSQRPPATSSGKASPAPAVGKPSTASGKEKERDKEKDAGAGKAKRGLPVEAPNTKAASPNAGAPPHPSTHQSPEMAVVFDPILRPAAKDLQLTLENERRAESDAHFMRGMLLEDTADADKAQDEYLKSLALDPSNVELSIKLSLVQLSRGDTPAAIGLLKDTIKAAPKRPQPYLALSYVYFKSLEKNDLAQKYAAQALEIDPANIYAYQYLAEIYAAQNQAAKIGPLLERASKIDSRDPEFWLQLGSLYAGYFLKGEQAKSPENLKKTSAIIQKAVALDNTSAEVLTRAAKFFADTDQAAEAIPIFQKILDIDPDQNTIRETLARAYVKAGQNDKAIATLQEMIRRNPVQGFAYQLLGSIYEDEKEYDKAGANYQQSLLVSPNQPDNYRTTALLLLQRLKKPEKAAEVLIDARRRFPDVPLFTYLLGVSLSAAKKYSQALPIFEQAMLEAQSGNSDILQGGDFYFQYGNAAEQAGLFDKAAELLRKSLTQEDNPQRIAETSNYLGYMWVERGQHLEDAGVLIRKALEIDPDNGAFLDSLGWYYFQTNQFDKALVELNHAVELIKPEDPVVYEHLGDTYSKLNDITKALTCWQKSLELGPEEPHKTAIIKKVEDSKALLTQARPVATPALP